MVQLFFGIGLLLAAFGSWRVWDALKMDVSVTVPGQEPVANMMLLQIQSTGITLGCAAFIAGLVLICAAIIVERLPMPKG